MLFDISPPITPRLAVWPGDTPPTREVLCDMAEGANLTLSTLRTSVHLGAHADAPSHYAVDGQGIGARPLDAYWGPCQVILVDVPRGRRVAWEDLRTEILAPRVLLATRSFPDPTAFNQDFCALDPGLVDALHALGVVLIGIDTPSVDLFDSKDLPAHQRLRAHDMANLEGLLLEGVPAGVYELVALPLRLEQFDASPVRAVLRTMEG
jgi:arylformamidase